MRDKRKILLLDRKSFLLLRTRGHQPVNRDRILNSARKVAKIRIFAKQNLFVTDQKDIVEFAVWEWKRAFIRKEERIKI